MRVRGFDSALVHFCAVVVLLAVGLPSGFATAAIAPAASSASAPAAQLLKTRKVSDGVRNYTLEEYFNQRGEYEVRVILNEERWYAPTSYRTLLIGRAIDVPSTFLQGLDESEALRPRRVTTWFIPSSFEISKPIEFIQTGDDPWPTARSVIETQISTSNKWYSWVLFEMLAPQVSIAISHAENFFEEIKQEQIDLLDLEVRVGHLELENPDDPFIPLARSVIADGWTSIRDRVKDERTRKVWLYAAGDVALTATAAKVFSIMGHWLAPATKAISESSVSQAVIKGYERLAEAVQKKAAKASAALGKSSKTISGAAARVSFLQLTAKEKVGRGISYLQGRSVVARVALKGMGNVIGVVKSGAAALPYIALTQTMQIVAETAANPDDLFDPNPIIMGKKMASDEDFIQNVAYMANETFWMAGVNNYLDTAKKKIAICGAIGLVDSVAMALLIKGEANPTRVAFDSVWEAGIGNIQTFADTSAIVYFQRLAEKTGNRKLRLLGYVVALVDQGAGYFGYALFSRMVDDMSKPSPVVNQSPTSKPELKLIPVLGPI